jgi:tRNA (guanine-N7-)-methyltransferase
MISSRFKYKLFGRFKGRKKIHHPSFMDLKKYQFNAEKDINKSKYSILDIGSGSGENALFLSNIYPKSKIITCELFEDGNINLVNQIIKNQIMNIRLFQGNVLEFLDLAEPLLTFDEIWILFPDPWPKIRHHKRRLINNIFLENISKYLKKSGKLMIATDSQSYIQSIIQNIFLMQNTYMWNNQKVSEWNYNNLELPRTKFYKKATKSNRNSMFFELLKI